MAKKRNIRLSAVLGVILLSAGVLILLVYAIAYLFDRDITMPCNYQVTISALISFGIAFVWKLMGEDKQ